MAKIMIESIQKTNFDSLQLLESRFAYNDSGNLATVRVMLCRM